MDISIGINRVPSIIASGGESIDEEYKRIIKKLLAIGLQPSGNKAADRAKLHEFEKRELLTELGAKGTGSVNVAKFVTISPQQIEQTKQKLQAKAKEEDNVENKEIQVAFQNKTGATQASTLNEYFIKKKKRIVT